MRYPIDSLDMCYGIQLADSCGDIGVTYVGVDARFFFDGHFGVSL